MNWSAVTSNIVIIAPVHHSKLPCTERGHANNIGRRLICSAELIGVYIELLHNKIQEADIAEIAANCLTNYTDKPEAKSNGAVRKPKVADGQNEVTCRIEFDII